MAGNWLTELTGARKPIIGMVHLPALPGTPLYDGAAGMQQVRDSTARDLEALQAGGIDAVMFCNENDRPYRLDADFASVAAMSDVVASLRGELTVPFGVNVLWDPRATLAVAAATGAAFAREIFCGAFAGDFGLWVRSAGDAFRYRREVGAESCRLLFNINAEFAAPIAPRPLPDVARSVVFSSAPDALCVSGPITGQPAEASGLAEVAQAVSGTGVPVLVNTGLRSSNAPELLRFADGAVVGSSLKVDGVTWNPVDERRVRELMDVVNGLD
jgi:membrane complex biogenesis BtpA family protein